MESKKTDTAQEAELLAVEAAGADAGEDSTEDTEEGLVLKLRKPFVFDGQTYTQVDLSGLEDVTAGVLESVGKIVSKKCPGLNPATLEMEMTYCNTLAARVTKKPLEFFERLPARDAVAMKSKIVGFLYGGDGED